MATKLSVISSQFATNAAAVAAAAGGGIATADITVLADLLNSLALSPDVYIPLAGLGKPSLVNQYPAPG
jgi:hypothetical protein